MMNLETALYFLDTNCRVQCPEISAQQARELGELLRSLQQERDELDAMTDELVRDGQGYAELIRKERDEARAEVERLKRIPVCHCLVCTHAREGDVEVDASDYERPGRIRSASRDPRDVAIERLRCATCGHGIAQHKATGLAASCGFWDPKDP